MDTEFPFETRTAVPFMGMLWIRIPKGYTDRGAFSPMVWHAVDTESGCWVNTDRDALSNGMLWIRNLLGGLEALIGTRTAGLGFCEGHAVDTELMWGNSAKVDAGNRTAVLEARCGHGPA